MSKEDSDDEYYAEMLSKKDEVDWTVPARKRRTVRAISAISDRDFVVAWQQSDTLEQVSRILCVTKTSASNKAARLRNLAVPLKKLK